MLRKLLFVLILCLFTVQTKPVSDSDPRLMGLVVLGTGTAITGAWIAKKGITRILFDKQNLKVSDKETSPTFARIVKSIFRRSVGIPVTAVGMGLGAIGVGSIIFSKELLNQTDWATTFATALVLMGIK